MAVELIDLIYLFLFTMNVFCVGFCRNVEDASQKIEGKMVVFLNELINLSIFTEITVKCEF